MIQQLRAWLRGPYRRMSWNWAHEWDVRTTHGVWHVSPNFDIWLGQWSLGIDVWCLGHWLHSFNVITRINLLCLSTGMSITWIEIGEESND